MFKLFCKCEFLFWFLLIFAGWSPWIFSYANSRYKSYSYHTEDMPPGFYLLQSNAGKWKWDDGSMFLGDSVFDFDSRSNAVANAWSIHRSRIEREGTRWEPAKLPEGKK